MTEEFCLSDKIREIKPVPMPMINFDNDTIPKKDVKEFIRLLLETYEGTDENWVRKDTIKKFAGEKLTIKQQEVNKQID